MFDWVEVWFFLFGVIFTINRIIKLCFLCVLCVSAGVTLSAIKTESFVMSLLPFIMFQPRK